MPRRVADSLIFDSLHLEGSLFVPAVLEKASRGELPNQRAADYRLPAGLSLLDEQGRSFRIASALWRTFESAQQRRDIIAAQATEGMVLELLRDALGFADIASCAAPIAIGDRAFPITALACSGRVPIIVAPHSLDVDQPDEAFAVRGAGARRRTAYQLAQQFLNAAEKSTWAIITNGRALRLVRDSDTLTRPAFLEADLELILREQRYADFAAVWRLFHASRAGDSDAAGSWETWRKQGQDQGERVREGLREGVTNALVAFGTGFLATSPNEALRARLQSGQLTVEGYFQQLLRLIYRCLFIFTTEERRNEDGVPLLHVDDGSPRARLARETFAAGYAFRRLRDRALRRSDFDRNGDLWVACRIVFRGLANGEPRLSLPALGGLFAASQCPDLEAAQLENRALLEAMRCLRWTGRGGGLSAIDYRNMGPEELGSVYESLLELVATVDLPTRRFGFIGLKGEGRIDGNARKTTGSYYTPDSLVQELLDSALEPLVERKLAARREDPAAAILSISVVDPACGSGHFLLAAARRLAEKLAEVRAVEGAVTPKDYRRALREVIARCIHGVDRNPMALELARTALWLEGYEPGQPLSFLDHHLVCGDALLGLIDFKSLTAGIPPEAFKPLTGDDKDACKALAAANRAALRAFERRRDTDFFRASETADLLKELAELEAMPEENPLEVEVKSAHYTTFLRHARDSQLSQAADLVVAAFLAPKPGSEIASLCPTTQTLADLLFPRRDSPVATAVMEHARALCRQARVLHWPLAFAGVFARGGFDCVLGNPPWEMLQLDPQEFFATHAPHVSNAQNMAARNREIAALKQSSPKIYAEYHQALRVTEATQAFVHASERFRYSGTGRINTASLFTETCLRIVTDIGRAGIVSPSGIASDSFTQDLWNHIADGRLVSFLSFENEEFVFRSVHHAFKFCLMTMSGGAELLQPQFLFFARNVEHLRDHRRRFELSQQDFRLINPNTRTCPVFRSQADAELTKKLYRRWPVLWREPAGEDPAQNPWKLEFQLMFMMNTDSVHFLNERTPTALPLYEAKMVHQFDHRWATYRWDPVEKEMATEDVSDAQKARADLVVQPRYWVEEQHVLSRLARVPRCVTQAWDAQDEESLRVAFATWIVAASADDDLAELRGPSASARQRAIDVGGHQFAALPISDGEWLKLKAVEDARRWRPLGEDELSVLHETSDLLTAARRILDHRSARWLMGWRDITNATNERTVIASVVPRAGAGDTLLLMFPEQQDRRLYACLLADQNSLVHDFVARQKIGGTHLKFHVKKQITILPPSAYSKADLDFIVPRVLELTYTARDLKPWAEDLGYNGEPFAYDLTRRVQLRAELDAYYARLYGLTRDELRYILDPSDTHGTDYPSVTFLGLKRKELAAFAEYRTRRLVLEAWDALAKQDLGPVEIPSSPKLTVSAPDWMDRPLTMPMTQRTRISADVYRASVVPQLIYQAGGRVNFERFRRAYWLLSEPLTLHRYARSSLGDIIEKWKRTDPPALEKQKFIPHLRGAVRYDLQFVTVGDERYLELRRINHLVQDEHTIFDARLALLVAELWPASEPIAPLTPQEEKAIRELQLVT